jgi:16S rRNA (cytosine1402-N4)-methyltransferase
MWNSQNPSFFHEPVLSKEVIKFLITDLSGIYVDGTVGGGGHSDLVLKQLSSEGKVIGIDRDKAAIDICRQRFSGYGDKISLMQGDFENVDLLLKELNISEIDGFLIDLGVSSYQIDNNERGFSYLKDGPLDMRMNPDKGKSAKEVINNYPQESLAAIFFNYGEERFSRRIARKIIEQRQKSTIETTLDLADLVRKITPGHKQIKTLSRIFQAVRIEVNDELGQLKRALERSYLLLKSGGRLVMITYHSLEARMVKRFFRGQEPTFSKQYLPKLESYYHFNILTRKSIFPSEEEIKHNQRARSAQLRAAEKL